MACGTIGPHRTKSIGQGRAAVIGYGLRGVRHAAWRLDREQAHRHSQQDTGQADDEKGHAPAEIMRDGAAQNSAHGRAQRHAERIDGQRSGALVRPIEVGNHRVAGRAGPGLANAHADPREQQMQEIIGKSTQRRGSAP